jgi:hypothetical protein
VLADGKILIAGGDSEGTAEVFDPSNLTFVGVSLRMSGPRSSHSAILLKSGKVLLAGGLSPDFAELSSAELFDPQHFQFTAVRSSMLGSRTRPMLRELPDGKVQVIGGDDARSMEMFNVEGGYFIARAQILPDLQSQTRIDEVLRAPSRAALIDNRPSSIRLTESGISLLRARSGLIEMLGASGTLSEQLDRSGHTTTEIPETGTVLVTGGKSSSGMTLMSTMNLSSSSATVTTDKTDYYPGETVIIAGTGWEPGETVSMNLHRDGSDVSTDTPLSAIVDGTGAFQNSDYVIQESDLGVSFLLTAVGQTSGFTAQTTFTDSPKVGAVSIGAQTPVEVCATGSASYTITVSRGSGPGSPGSFTATLSVTTVLPTGATASFSPNPVSLASGDTSKTATLTITTTAATPTGSTSFAVKAATSASDFAEATNGVLLVDTTAPVITLNGANPMTIECHTTFSDPGATATDNCPDAITVTPTGTVNANIPGSYTLTYTATDAKGNIATKTRTVNVVDTTPPLITLVGANPMTVECHTVFADPGATASDTCAGNLTGAITVSGSVNPNVVGAYTLTYTVSDGPEGNSASTTRTVNVVDTTKPIITLNGGATLTVECHTAFADPGATATDACAGDLTGSIVVTGSVNPNAVGSYTLHYNVIDPSSNAAIQVDRTVNVVDTIAPTITLTGANPFNVECHTSFSDPGATASDSCDTSLVAAIASGTVNVNIPGDYVITYNASDASGNAAISVSRTVHVRDTIAPIITLTGANPFNVECHTSFSDPGATASDSCDTSLVAAIASGSVNVNVPGDYFITYNASDASGNAAISVSRTVHVRDTIAPIITLTGDNPLNVECHSAYSDPGATASDSCDTSLVAAIASGSVNVNVPGDYLITYNASDASGNAATSVSRTVHVRDTIAPIITLTGDNPLNVECHSTYSDPGATASDSCDTSLVAAIASGSVNVNVPGDYLITYNASDASANAATSVSRTVHVRDTIAPTITIVGDNPMTVECHGAFIDPGATASDSCDTSLVTAIASGSVNVNLPGDYFITYNASDASGNAATAATRTIHVVDTTPPTITVVGDNSITVECHGTFVDPGATASDSCDTSLVTAIASGSIDVNTPGDYTITYNASDATGNAAASVSRAVHVRDTIAPTITVVGDNPITVECHGAFIDPGATASDSCDTGVVAAIASGSVNVNTPGDYTITYNASDASGNPATPATRIVHVVDTTPPTITVVGDNPMTVECHGVFVDPGATASDSCDSGVMAATPTGTVNVNTPGEYTITYNASDTSGNTASPATRTVHVVDNAPPVITIVGDNPITVECHGSFVDPGATANDSCDAGVTTATASGTVNAHAPGDYTITYNASDASGNHATPVTRTVHVVDSAAPVISINGANPLNVECHGAFSDPGAAASDSCDSGVTAATPSGSVNVNVPGDYTITYNASDASGNHATPVTRVVHVQDTTAPIITVVGANPLIVECHTSFSDPGATANDTCTGSVTVTPSGSVDMNTPGNYTINYSASDGHGNTATASRTVCVKDTQKPVITLIGASPMIVALGSSFTDPGATATDSCAGDLTGSILASGSVNTAVVGTYTRTYNVSDPSNNAAVPVTRTVRVQYSSSCGRVIQPPINADGSSVFKQKSTVPAKFRVCDANGVSVGTPGVVVSFSLIQIISGTTSATVNEPVDSTTPDTAFRWDPTDQQWIYNINTKSLQANKTYVFQIVLNDGTSIYFQFGLK